MPERVPRSKPRLPDLGLHGKSVEDLPDPNRVVVRVSDINTRQLRSIRTSQARRIVEGCYKAVSSSAPHSVNREASMTWSSSFFRLESSSGEMFDTRPPGRTPLGTGRRPVTDCATER